MAGPLDTFRFNVGIGEKLTEAANGTALDINTRPLRPRRPPPRLTSQDQRRDPARGLSNAPPNFSLPVLPHVVTFQGISAAISKAYRSPDEAIKHSLDNARFMRNDASVMECVEARQRGTALLDWQLEVDGPNLPYHKALTDRLTRILKQTPFFLKYRENLLHALWYGRYAVQNLFGWQVGGGRRDIVIRDWKPINGDKLVFRYDDGRQDHPENQVGIRVGPWAGLGDLVQGRKVEATELGLTTFLSPDERQWLAIHKHMIEDAAYESPLDSGSIHGLGIRSRIYWTWFQKQETLAMLMEYLERSALGFEIWTYPEGNPEAKAQTEQAARNRIGRKNIILFPKPIGDDNDAYGVEHYEPSAAGAEALKAIITDYFGHQMKRYILGQTLSSEAAATGLGSGVADLHYQTFLDIIKYDATNLEETITREVLLPLKRWNDPKAAGVDVRFVINTQSPDTESKLGAMEKAWNMGARLRTADVLDLIGASMPTESDEVLQNPAASGQQPGMPGAPGMESGGNGTTSVSMAGAMGGELAKSMQKKLDQATGMEYTMAEGMGVLSKTADHYAKRAKPAAGQGAFAWDESDHPRDEAGKFSEKASGSNASEDEPFSLVNAPAKWGGQDFGSTGSQQKKFLAGMMDLAGQQDLFDTEGTAETEERQPKQAVILDALRKDQRVSMALGELKRKMDTGEFRPFGDRNTPSDWQPVLDAISQAARISPGAAMELAQQLVDDGDLEDEEPTTPTDQQRSWRVSGLEVKEVGGHSDFRFGVVHIASGKTVHKTSSAKKAHEALVAIAPLANWTASAEQLKSIPGLSAKLRKAIPYANPCDSVEAAALETDTDPSEAQRAAGNYRKGRCRLHGLEIVIETPKGAIRRGTDRDGKEWSIAMPHHYGYIRRTESEADGDHVDVFVGPAPESEIVFVVDQQNPKSGRFDEHKVMIGWHSRDEAETAYKSAYEDGWQGLRAISPMTMPQFKAWLERGDTGKPLAGQLDVARYSKWRESDHPRDEAGRWAEDTGGNAGGRSGGGTGGSNRPTIEIKGDEFSTKSGDIKKVVAEATDFFQRHIAGREFVNRETGRRIRVPKKAVRKAVSHLPDDGPVLALTKLPELLEQAEYAKPPELPRKPDRNVRMFHYFVADLTLRGKASRTKIVIREDGNGDWFYDQHITEKAEDSPLSRSWPLAEQTGPTGESSKGSIDRLTGEVKESEGDDLKDRFRRAVDVARYQVARYREAAPDASGKSSQHKAGWRNVGGAPAYVAASGKITKACPGLKGHNVADITNESDKSREARDAKQQAHENRQHEIRRDLHARAKQVAPPGHVALIKHDGAFHAYGPDAAIIKAAINVGNGDRAHIEEADLEQHLGRLWTKGYQTKIVRPEDLPEVPARPKSETTAKPRGRITAQAAQAIAAAAQDHGVDAGDLTEALDFVWQEKAAAINEREKAKQSARQLTGLTQRDVERLKNAGFDYTSAAGKVGGATGEKLRHFDSFAQEIAREHPELGLGDADSRQIDFGAGLWYLLAEGRRWVPVKHDPEIIREAVALVQANAYSSQFSPNDPELVPFAMRGRIERYRQWQVGRYDRFRRTAGGMRGSGG